MYRQVRGKDCVGTRQTLNATNRGVPLKESFASVLILFENGGFTLKTLQMFVRRPQCAG